MDPRSGTPPPATATARPTRWPAALVGNRLAMLASYSMVSVVSTSTSLVTLGLLVGVAGVGATPANLAATALGTVPSFELNRRWVWGQHGRRSLVRQVVPFCVLSLTGLVLSTLAVGAAASRTAGWGRGWHTVAVLAANVAAYGSLWVAQFVILDRLLFARRPTGAQVPETTPGASGSRTVKDAPPSGPRPAVAVPPAEATMAATMESPRPLPPLSRDREGSAR